MKKLRFVLIIVCSIVGGIEFIMSLALLAVGSYLSLFETVTRDILEAFQLPTPVNQHHFKVFYVTTLISGVLLFISCVMNLVGAWIASFSPRKKTKMVSIFLLGFAIYISLLVAVIQLTGGAYGNSISYDLSYENYEDRYIPIFRDRYNRDRTNENSSSIDKLHQILECCGYIGPDSYSTTVDIPFSCCRELNNNTVCDTNNVTQIYTQGCVERTYEAWLIYVYEFFKLIALAVLSSTILYPVAVATAGMLLFVMMIEKY